MQHQSEGLSRRGFLKILAASSVPVLLAACAPQSAPAAGGGAAAPAGEKVGVRFVAMDYDNRMQPDTQAVMDAFNASQQAIEATLEVVGWPDGRNLLLTQISGGQAPDIFNGSGQWMLEFTSASETSELDDLLGKEFLSNFQESGIKAMTVNGKLYGMPYFLDPRGLYYRTDLFEEKGLKAPQTWADVREAAKALTNSPSLYGIGLGPDDYWWYAWIGAHGAGVDLAPWSEDGHSLIANDEGLAAVQFLTDIILADQTSQPSPHNANRDSDLQPLFLGKQMAMLETGSWMPTIISHDAPDMKYDVAQLPVAKADMQHPNVFWPDCVMMANQSKYKEQAAELLKFMFNAENRLQFALQRGVIPERIDVGKDPKYVDPNDPLTKFKEFFVKELATAHNVFLTPWPATGSEDNTSINNALARIWLGEASVKDAMTAAAQEIDKRHKLS
ncbi:MAG: extracellular solute-binding protein [Caldilineaceae bacterium]